MSYFDVPTRWVIPEAALRRSLQEMAIDGARGCEGVAMWLGHYDRDTAVVTHIAVLRGPGVRKAPDQLLIGADLMNDIADSCDRASPETHRPNPFARAPLWDRPFEGRSGVRHRRTRLCLGRGARLRHAREYPDIRVRRARL